MLTSPRWAATHGQAAIRQDNAYRDDRVQVRRSNGYQPSVPGAPLKGPVTLLVIQPP
jgi:hypothetical protein